DSRLYSLWTALTGLVFVGLALGGLRWRRRGIALSGQRSAALAVIVAAVAAVAASLAYYNLHFWQPQGRYLFAAIVPLALLFVLGLREVVPAPARAPTLGLICA